jgi:hypothetical protein
MQQVGMPLALWTVDITAHMTRHMTWQRPASHQPVHPCGKWPLAAQRLLDQVAARPKS